MLWHKVLVLLKKRADFMAAWYAHRLPKDTFAYAFLPLRVVLLFLNLPTDLCPLLFDLQQCIPVDYPRHAIIEGVLQAIWDGEFFLTDLHEYRLCK